MIIENFFKLGGIGPGLKTYKSDDPTKILLQEDTNRKGEKAIHPADQIHTYIEIDRPKDENYSKILFN